MTDSNIQAIFGEFCSYKYPNAVLFLNESLQDFTGLFVTVVQFCKNFFQYCVENDVEDSFFVILFSHCFDFSFGLMFASLSFLLYDHK